MTKITLRGADLGVCALALDLADKGYERARKAALAVELTPLECQGKQGALAATRKVLRPPTATPEDDGHGPSATADQRPDLTGAMREVLCVGLHLLVGECEKAKTREIALGIGITGTVEQILHARQLLRQFGEQLDAVAA